MILDSENCPLIVNSQRICVIESRPVEATIIQHGSYELCHETLMIFNKEIIAKQSKITSFNLENCTKCQNLAMKNKNLEQKLVEQDEIIKDLMEKCNKYKKHNDKYLVLMKFIDDQRKDIHLDDVSLLDSTNQICIDIAYPSVMINKAQATHLETIKSCGAAARVLMDYLFEVHEFRGKNCTWLEKQFPEKIGAIKNYCRCKFQTDSLKVTKAITGKCHGT